MPRNEPLRKSPLDEVERVVRLRRDWHREVPLPHNQSASLELSIILDLIRAAREGRSTKAWHPHD